jgi:hypothetical protein
MRAGGSFRLSPMEALPLQGFFRASPIRPWQAPPKRIGCRMAIHESRALLPTITIRPPYVAGLLSPLLCDQSALRRFQSRVGDAQQIYRGKFDRLPHATGELTTSVLHGYGLRCQWPTRPAPYASDPVLVHQFVHFLHASVRPLLATTPLLFAMTSPPSGCQKDFHLRAVEHARHTSRKAAGTSGGPFCLLTKLLTTRSKVQSWHGLFARPQRGPYPGSPD